MSSQSVKVPPIEKTRSFCIRKTLEANWHTSVIKSADSNSGPIPDQCIAFFWNTLSIFLVCSFYHLYLVFFVYIFHLFRFHVLPVEGCRSTTESFCFSKILGQRTFSLYLICLILAALQFSIMWGIHSIISANTCIGLFTFISLHTHTFMYFCWIKNQREDIYVNVLVCYKERISQNSV